MQSAWHFLDFCDVHTEGGAPVEVRLPRAPREPLEEDLLLSRIEQEFGLWLVWEDAWRKDGEHARRPIDLASTQPSHRATFQPDEGDVMVWLLAVDRHAGTTCASAWTKSEWFSPGSLDSGRWSRDSCGWKYGDARTPDARSGILCIEPLGPRLVSMRRSR